MANVFVDENSLSDIADSIRAKNGSADTYKPSEMAAAIDAISGGGITPTGTKSISITANGTTTEDVTNYEYAEITVSVSGGSSTLGTKTITANGTYDASDDSLDGYSSVTVNVSSGGTHTETYSDWANKAVTSSTGAITTNANRIMLPHSLYRYSTMTVSASYDYAIFACNEVTAYSGAIGCTASYVGGWTGSAWATSLTWHNGGSTVDLTAITNWDTYGFFILLRNTGSDSAISTTVGESVTFTYDDSNDPRMY